MTGSGIRRPPCRDAASGKGSADERIRPPGAKKDRKQDGWK